MMSSLLKYQKSDGLWAQLVDYGTMWTETSGSAMFAYAFIQGVANGWLDELIYGTASRRAWKQLNSYLRPNYDIREVCEVQVRRTAKAGMKTVRGLSETLTARPECCGAHLLSQI